MERRGQLGRVGRDALRLLGLDRVLDDLREPDDRPGEGAFGRARQGPGDARVVDVDEPERSAARLALAEAARITLANALALLGISAPESM